MFEKWSDGTEEYVAVNLVYQAVDQLQGRTLLSLEVPPMVKPITISGLTANSDGLYRLTDVDAHFAAAMAEYDAIVDDVTAVKAVKPTDNARSAAVFNLQGQRLDNAQHGVNIIGGEKKVVK